MLDEELDDLPKNHPNYTSAVDRLPIGESFAVAQRVDLAFGIGDEDRKKHMEAARSRLDNMVSRSRKKYKGRTFTVEAFCSLAPRGAVMFAVAVATRLT